VTVIPRSGGEQAGLKGGAAPLVDVQLVGMLTDDGQRIDRGVVWRVFAETGGPAGKARLVSTHRDATPLVRLAPGEYLINMTFGRAHLTRKLAVKPGAAVTETFVLNAGGLRLRAILPGGSDLSDRATSYEVRTGERDASGERPVIISGVRPGVIIRLNAGLYHIVSTYGDANAIIRADITVEAGKLTEAVVTHKGARVSFRLLNRAGGEVLPDTQWSIHSAQGELVKESVGALITHVLVPGPYIVSARQGGQTYRREFTVGGNDPLQVEVVAQ
jgi:hypothetical protein